MPVETAAAHDDTPSGDGASGDGSFYAGGSPLSGSCPGSPTGAVDHTDGPRTGAVLLAEDNMFMQELTADLIRSTGGGRHVVCASNGEAALNALTASDAPECAARAPNAPATP